MGRRAASRRRIRPRTAKSQRTALFRHPLVRAAWPWLVALELGATYLARIGWPLLRGEVVVVDRYLLSALAELAGWLGRGTSRAARRGGCCGC